LHRLAAYSRHDVHASDSMKVLLVRPPKPNPKLGAHLASEPLSLETAAAGLRDCDVRLFDMQIERRGLTEVLDDFEPDLLGISGYTADVYNMRSLLREARRQRHDLFTVVGGHHATIRPEDFARSPVDAIVVGLGAAPFAELVRALQRRADWREIPGIAFPVGSELRFAPERRLPRNLDGDPFPRRDLVARHWKKYAVLGNPIGLINTSKGCPHRCRFCSIINEMKGKYVTKSAERVADELTRMPQRVIRFADGNTFGSIKRMRRLQEILKGAGLDKTYMFDIRADTVVANADLIHRWKEVGLDLVAVGLESIRESRLRELGKGSTVEDNDRAIDILHDAGIKIVGQFMIDHDFEEADFDHLVEYVIEKRIHIPSFCITTPFPGTPLFEETKDDLITDDYQQLDCFHSVLPTRLERERFLQRYVDLYANCYSLGRLGDSAMRRLRLRGRANELPFSLMLLIKLHLTLRKRSIERAYGIT
jgi:radical SAM superfamily enzyme YgiQ (UPF0313 family)